jgi:hypothetical protein
MVVFIGVQCRQALGRMQTLLDFLHFKANCTIPNNIEQAAKCRAELRRAKTNVSGRNAKQYTACNIIQSSQTRRESMHVHIYVYVCVMYLYMYVRMYVSFNDFRVMQ